MKKKVLALVMAVMMLAMMLTGCIQTDIGVKVEKDGGGSISATLGLEKEFYEMLKENGSDPFEGKETTEYTYEDSTYVSYTEVTKYDSYEDMEKALLEMTYATDLIEDTETEEDTEMNDIVLLNASVIDEPEAAEQDNRIFSAVSIEKDGGVFNSSYIFNAVMNPQSNEESEYDLNEIFKVTLTVEMPAEITESKGGKVEGNKITFDITDITESQELAATCEMSNTGAIIGVIAVAFVVIMVGVFCFMKFKGNQGR